ncbi:heat shock protein 70, partial [Ramicandelaber brevisporus]
MTAFEGAIGIDLGTTYSCVAVWDTEQRVEILQNEQGSRTTASYVAFTAEERLIGDAAKNQAAMNPKNTVFDAKRLIGRRFNDKEVQKDMESWPFKVVDDENNNPLIEVEFKGETKKFTPQEISSMVLLKMKEIAEAKLGKTVTKAVITVPAYFNDAQRQATKDAGAIAGLEVLRIINEPTAAAIAYGLDNKSEKEKKVLIFDLGGGTFDVSLLSIQGGIFTVLATAGDTHLGGEDFDANVLAHLAADFKRKNGGKDLTGDARAVRRLRTAAERAKRTLSSSTTTTIEIDSLFDGVDYSATLTRAKFEEINNKVFLSTIKPVEQVLADAKVSKKDVHDVMQGGIMAVVVPRNTPIPTIKKKTFTTADDDQTQVTFPVYEGERAMTKDNNMLGQFDLVGIPPMPRGVPELEVTFDIDADGILNVTAVDKATGRKANVVISNSTGHLSAAEIERMVKEAEQFKNQDKKIEEAVQAKQEFEYYLHQVESTYEDAMKANKLKKNDKKAIEDALAEAMTWLEISGSAATDKNSFSTQQKKLQRSIGKAFQNFYKQ